MSVRRRLAVRPEHVVEVFGQDHADRMNGVVAIESLVLEFEEAASLRDRIAFLSRQILYG